MKKIIIIAVIIVVVILLCIYGTKGKKEENVVENKLEENIVENTVENNIVENSVVENVTSKKEEKTYVNEYSITNNIYEQNSEVGTTNNKQKAIDLVKKTWGDDTTVSFRCDSVTNNGIYIIAVVSKETMTVKNYFRVNLETGDVEVDY